MAHQGNQEKLPTMEVETQSFRLSGPEGGQSLHPPDTHLKHAGAQKNCRWEAFCRVLCGGQSKGPLFTGGVNWESGPG